MHSTMNFYSQEFRDLFRPSLDFLDFSTISSDSGLGEHNSPSLSSRGSVASDCTEEGDVSSSPRESSLSLATICSGISCPSATFTLESDAPEPEVMLETADSATLYHENEFQQVTYAKRSSSLKSACTPPGTPGPCKMVRFADAFGLDLVTVKHIVNEDCPPTIPASVRGGLSWSTDPDSDSHSHKGTGPTTGDTSQQFKVKRTYRPCFSQPGNSANFLRRVVEQNICLETVVFDDVRHQLCGSVAVRNLTYAKKVLLRYTFNNWFSHNDIPATYMEPLLVDPKSPQAAGLYSFQHGPGVDRFQFSLYLPDSILHEEKLQFALLYRTERYGEEYWDNNFGQNYACMMIEILQEVK